MDIISCGQDMEKIESLSFLHVATFIIITLLIFLVNLVRMIYQM